MKDRYGKVHIAANYNLDNLICIVDNNKSSKIYYLLIIYIKNG